MKYVIYSTEYMKEPTFYGTARTIWDAEKIVDDLFDEYYEQNLDKAIQYAIDWLKDLHEWEHCDYAPYDIVVYRRHGTAFYDTEDDLLSDIERHVTGVSIADYMSRVIPKFKIGTTV